MQRIRTRLPALQQCAQVEDAESAMIEGAWRNHEEADPREEAIGDDGGGEDALGGGKIESSRECLRLLADPPMPMMQCLVCLCVLMSHGLRQQ